MKGIVKLGAILFSVCSIAAGLLAFFADFTAEPIAEQAKREEQEALTKVAPTATEFREAGDGKWEALSTSGKVGDVISVKAKGYGGPIAMVAGIDGNRKVTGVRVITHTETAGLGAKVTGEAFLGQFVGKTASQLRLKKDDGASGTIEALSAATISSRAVTEALRAALSAQ
jgi:Na+-translocating ferredoxin:NAD+ oxidoreductase subunit G